MLYCHGSHDLKMVCEKGYTSYLQCHCGYNELIPGAKPWDPDDPVYGPLTKKDWIRIGIWCVIGAVLQIGIMYKFGLLDSWLSTF